MSATETLVRRVVKSQVLAALTSPHGVDRYLEIVNPLWAAHEVRARVVRVQPQTPEVRTLTLQPTSTWAGFRAGQHVLVGVEIEGARRTTRCFSISSSATGGPGAFDITVRGHDEGLVSKYLAQRAAPGLVVHLSQAQGEFTLPTPLPDRLLMISGGSGITPLMSMVRTLVDQRYDGHVTFLHTSRTQADTIFADELAVLANRENVTMNISHTRAGGQRLTAQRLADLVPDFATIETFVCGPSGLVDQVRRAFEGAGSAERLRVEYFKTSTIRPMVDGTAAGRISFAASGRQADNTGDTLLEQAEALGLRPEFGCRMGICLTCTSRKSEGTVRNVVTGAESSRPDEDIQVCVSTPVGDCAVNL